MAYLTGVVVSAILFAIMSIISYFSGSEKSLKNKLKTTEDVSNYTLAFLLVSLSSWVFVLLVIFGFIYKGLKNLFKRIFKVQDDGKT